MASTFAISSPPLPLTTVFAPPSYCLATLYVTSIGPDREYDTLVRLGPSNDPSCLPGGYAEGGYYSPGICPMSYMPACTKDFRATVAPEVTAVKCCPSDYYAENNCQDSAGCYSYLSADSSGILSTENGPLASTKWISISGGEGEEQYITADAVNIRYRISDLVSVTILPDPISDNYDQARFDSSSMITIIVFAAVSSLYPLCLACIWVCLRRKRGRSNLKVSREPENTIYFNKSPAARGLCVFGLVLAWLTGYALLAAGIYFLRVGEVSISVGRITKDIIPLTLNVFVTILNEVLGYVHSASLKWALQREGRLAFNSNLRLMTSARTSNTNKWYSNAFVLFCIVISYSSTSLVFLSDDEPFGSAEDINTNHSSSIYEPQVHISGFALATLALGVLGQSAIGTCCIFSRASVSTWSSSPFSTSAACMGSQARPLRHNSGRCMMSVYEFSEAAQSRYPKSKQKSAYRSHKEIRRILFLIWSLVILCALWGVIVFRVVRRHGHSGGSNLGNDWSFFPVPDGNIDRQDRNSGHGTSYLTPVSWNWYGSGTLENPLKVDIGNIAGGFSLISSIQALFTLGLHCCELIINCSRDEEIWRATYSSSRGSDPDTNALLTVLKSWQTLLLLAFKPAIHWMFGLAMSVHFSKGVVMRPPQIFYLTAMTVLVALFVSYLAFRRPKGPQPATFGHLQTLVDVIDVWPRKGDKLYWGHKSSDFNICHAGTDSRPLEKVLMGCRYQG